MKKVYKSFHTPVLQLQYNWGKELLIIHRGFLVKRKHFLRIETQKNLSTT